MYQNWAATKGGVQSVIILGATPMGYNTDQLGKISGKASQIGGKQQLSNWTYGPPNRREIITGTGNLASFLGLVRSWTFENNRQPPF